MLWTLIKKDFLLNYALLLHPQLALKDKKKRKQLFSLAVGVVFLVVYVYLGMRYLLGQFDAFVTLGVADLFITQGYVIYTFFLLIFGVATVFGQLYFSSDVTIMLRLPISHESLFASKLISLTLSNLIYAVVITVPISLKYGMSLGEGPLFYLYTLLLLPSTTLYTVSILALIIVLIMRFANRIPNMKGILQFLGMAAIIGMSIGFQIFVQKTAPSTGAGLSIVEILKDNQALMYRLLPHLQWVVQALTNGDVLIRTFYALVMVFVSVGVFYLTIRIGTGALIKGVSDNKVTGGRRKGKVGTIAYTKRPVAWDIAWKDLITIFKTPIYLFNIGLVGFLMPLFMLIPFITQPQFFSELSTFQPVIQGFLKGNVQVSMGIGFGVGFAITLFLSATGQAATTSITREGKQIWLMKTLPIRYEDQVKGRVLASALLSLLSVVPMALIIVLLLRPPVIVMVCFTIASVVVAVFMANAGLLVDIRSPKLLWDNPQEAIKQNMNVFLFSLGLIFYSGVLSFVVYQLFSRETVVGDNFFVVVVALLVIHCVFAYGLYRLNCKLLEKRMPYYDVAD